MVMFGKSFKGVRIAVFVGALFVAALKLVLQSYPIKMDSYVSNLDKKMPDGISVSFARPVLTWDFWMRPFELVVSDVHLCRMRGKDKRCVHASRLGVVFSLWSLIRHQKLTPASLRIDDLSYGKGDLKKTSSTLAYVLKGAKEAEKTKRTPWWQTYRDPCSVHLVGGGHTLSVDYAWFPDRVTLRGSGWADLESFVTKTPLEFLDTMTLRGQFDLFIEHNKDDWQGTLSIQGRSPRKQKLVANVVLQPKRIVLEDAFFREALVEAKLEGQLVLDKNNDYALSVTTLYTPFHNVLKVWPKDQGKMHAWLKAHVV